MTIGTCGWMEREWLAGVTSSSRRFFRAARYMDDVLVALSTSDKWDKEMFLSRLAEV